MNNMFRHNGFKKNSDHIKYCNIKLEDVYKFEQGKSMVDTPTKYCY